MSTRRGSECESIRRLLPDYATRHGLIPEESHVRSHLDECPACAGELRALEMTGEMLERARLEPAPDQWDAIRSRLTPREAPGSGSRVRAWFGRYRLPSAVGVAGAALALALMLMSGPQDIAEIEADVYMSNHASMSWREPFADKAALGLAAVAQFEEESEN